MNEIKIFENPEFGQVRTMEVEGNIYFVASDVAKALGYTNTSKAINDHCKGVTKRYTLTKGGKQEVNIIPEGDVYRLVTHSKLPTAEKFEEWVFDEVLPTIRKHGGYLTPAAIEKTLMDPDYLIQLATMLKEEKAKRLSAETTVAKQNQLIGELKPKADYTDKILSSKSVVNITQIAKDYGMSGAAMNKKLHELHIIYQCGGQWLLYSAYQSKGYTHSKTIDITHSDGRPDVMMQTKWTQKGRLFLYNLLKKNGILPLIEQGTAPVKAVSQDNVISFSDARKGLKEDA